MRVKRLFLAGLLGLLTLVFAAELALRWKPPVMLQRFDTGAEGNGPQLDPELRVHTLDPELGYRPILSGAAFDRFGVKHNDYAPAKPAHKTRLLFIGDSVTHRARIIQGLRQVFGEDDYEYWNAGVEGYNSFQTSRYYASLTGIAEDHTLLTFHLNDFTVTPITFLEGDTRMLVRAGHSNLKIHATLYDASYLYRLYLARAAHRAGTIPFEQQTAMVREGLADIRNEAEERGVRLSVFILPWFETPETWRPGIRERYDAVQTLLEELGIEHFDLTPVLQEALDDGLDVLELVDDPDYRAHPSLEFGLRAARHLQRQDFRP